MAEKKCHTHDHILVAETGASFFPHECIKYITPVVLQVIFLHGLNISPFGNVKLEALPIQGQWAQKPHDKVPRGSRRPFNIISPYFLAYLNIVKQIQNLDSGMPFLFYDQNTPFGHTVKLQI